MTDDQATLRLLVERYAWSIDQRAWADLADCFAADARGNYDGQPVLRGRDAIVGFIRGVVEGYRAAMHAVSNVRFTVRGDEAHGESYATATLVVPTAVGMQVVSRGVHYTDRCARTDGGWEIAERTHRALWMTVAPGLLP